ncbi:hypothetical protein HHI36_016098 [Cryptolaemus montrouzieri]|uniref:Uncharacterized protein n=1 Tax=Cryptolaemus montrouzieri TaxID=559131 RepID=A0ABD2NII1_9CUCU
MGLGFSNERQLYSDKQSTTEMAPNKARKATPALDFVFPENAYDPPENGLNFNEIYLPEEVLILIFSYIPVCDILKMGLVCKRWYNSLRMHTLWSTLYFKKYKTIPKPLPWYTFYALFSTNYFNGNLLKNNCGQNKFKHWVILKNGGHKLKIENNATGCEPYPADCPDFMGAKTCFVTSFSMSQKIQIIRLKNNLVKYIVEKHKPHLYASEWVAGRFDCGGLYDLRVILYSESMKIESICEKKDYDYDFENYEEGYLDEPTVKNGILMVEAGQLKYNGNEATKWQKIQVLLKDYPNGVEGVLFEHCGVDNQFWAGHYGPKMAGGVVKFVFESMEPEQDVTINDEMDVSTN